MLLSFCRATPSFSFCFHLLSLSFSLLLFYTPTYLCSLEVHPALRFSPLSTSMSDPNQPLHHRMLDMPSYLTRNSNFLPANETPVSAPTSKTCSPFQRNTLSRRHLHHYAIQFIYTTLMLVNHQVSAQASGGGASMGGNDGTAIGKGLTTPDTTNDRRSAGGDGIPNRWDGSRRRRRLSGAAVIGICIGVTIIIVDLMILLVWLHRRKLRKAQEQAKENLSREQQANLVGRDSGVVGQAGTEGNLPPGVPCTSSPHPLLLGANGSAGQPTRRSSSFQRLSRYGSTKWRELRRLGSRDKPTPPAPKPNKQAAHVLPLYTPPTFDSFEDSDELDHPTPTLSSPPRLSDMPSGSKDEILPPLDLATSCHTLSLDTPNAPVVKIEGKGYSFGTHWSPASPASTSTLGGYQGHQQLWGALDSLSEQSAGAIHYHDGSSGFRGSRLSQDWPIRPV